MKLLLYCTKAKPYLTKGNDGSVYPSCCISNGILDWHLNGKIVAECDFEVEEICSERLDDGVGYEPIFYTETIDNISKKSCLTQFEIENYLGCKAGGEVVGYAIHIKNLHIFDKPKELSEYGMDFPISPIVKAPQNMMYANGIGERYILISIRSEWLCKILNGNKTIEVRKKVLKGMVK